MLKHINKYWKDYKMSGKIYVCIVCGHTLSEEDYLSLPDSVNCPECGVSKEDYVLMDA